MGASDGQASTVFLGALRWFRNRASEPRRRTAAHRLVHRSIDSVPGVAGRGDALVAGLYEFGGQAVRATEVGERGDTPWRYREAGDYWLAELHSFDWLRDLRAAGTSLAAERSRSMVLDWLQQHRSLDNTAAWTPEVIGTTPLGLARPWRIPAAGRRRRIHPALPSGAPTFRLAIWREPPATRVRGCRNCSPIGD